MENLELLDLFLSLEPLYKAKLGNPFFKGLPKKSWAEVSARSNEEKVALVELLINEVPYFAGGQILQGIFPAGMEADGLAKELLAAHKKLAGALLAHENEVILCENGEVPLETSIDGLEFSQRVFNLLRRSSVTTLRTLGPKYFALSETRGCGKASLKEVRTYLIKNNLLPIDPR